MATAVDVCVEAVVENQIQEVTLDGQEIYIQPLSMSDNLAKLAHKIDFSKDESDEKGKPTSEGDKETEEEKAITPFQPSLWPWDSVRNKLKASLTEMSVLLDVLNLSKDKRYMILDPVTTEAPESKPGFQLMAKKKGLASASSILISGAERLKKSQIEAAARKNVPDFHTELNSLRQNWRLKRVGNVILGDLSYKSAGSRFWQSGTFEVTKSEGGAMDAGDASVAQKSSLQVSVPSELEGVAYIQVTIKKLGENTDLASAELKLNNNFGGTVPSDVHWQRKLEAAQNVIFCKEVFSQLAREAVQPESSIPHIVVGNQIFSHLFPGIQISIALCHYTDKERRSQEYSHNHVLEHSLHQLLREVHFRNLYQPKPHPVSATIGVSKRRRLAGPHALSREQLIEMSQRKTLLEQVIEQARHIVLRQQTIDVIDDMAMRIPDPQITAHWSNISSPTESPIKIYITSAGYENIRTPVSLHVGIDSLKVICKDGKVLHLSNDEKELRDLIMCQIAQHHINNIQSCLCKAVGWQILSINTHLGIGEVEPVGNAHAIVLSSPDGNRLLSIRSGPVTGLTVHMQRCPAAKQEENPSHHKDPASVVRDPKWKNIGGPWVEIHLDKIDGRNVVNKVELLMACLTSEGS